MSIKTVEELMHERGQSNFSKVTLTNGKSILVKRLDQKLFFDLAKEYGWKIKGIKPLTQQQYEENKTSKTFRLFH